jgi:hypothetical protein
MPGGADKPFDKGSGIDSGAAWSAMDDADLKHMLKSGKALREIADVLQRKVDEVERRVIELRREEKRSAADNNGGSQ